MNLKNPKNQHYWVKKIQEWKKSKKSIAQWCRENNIIYSTFLYWRDKLQGVSVSNKKAPLFIEITDNGSVDTGIEIQCNDISVQISKNFDSATLLQTLRLVRKV